MINPATGLEDPNYSGASADDDKNKKKPAKGDDGELTEAQLAKAFEHPRFKELIDKSHELEDIKKKQKEADEKKLKEKEEFKTLAEQKEQEVTDLKKKLDNQSKTQALMTQAIAQGVRKEALEDVIKLVDLESVSLDANGKVVNADSAIKTLLATKPYLLTDPTKVTIGTPTTGGDNNAGKQFWKWSEIQEKSRNHTWYEANKAEIEAAKSEGRIDYQK